MTVLRLILKNEKKNVLRYSKNIPNESAGNEYFLGSEYSFFNMKSRTFHFEK